MVEVYGLDMNAQSLDVQAALFSEQNYAKIFSEYRMEKIKKYRKENTKHQSIAAGWLLDHVLRQHGMTERTAEFDTGAHGKRLLCAAEGKTADVNLSHSGQYIVCAYNECGTVGIDAECVREDAEVMRIAKRFFSKVEIDWLEKQKEKAEAFCILWTRKESFVKRLGAGLSVPLDSFSVLEQETTEKRSGASEDLKEEQESVFWKDYKKGNCRIALCAETADFPEQINWQKISKKTLAKLEIVW